MKQFLIAVLSLGLGLVASHAQQPSPTPLTTEHTVYVPFDKLEDVFENQGRGVFLPYREFLDLWNKVNLPAVTHPDQPPAEGVLAAARYTGKVEGDTAVFQVNLQLESFKDGWSTLSLGPNQTFADIKSTAILKNDDKGSSIIFPAKGKYTLDATLHALITHDAGRSTLNLSLPRAAAAQFELIIPGKGLDFTINSGCAFTTQEQPDGNTRLIVYFKNIPDTQITWQRRAVATTLQPLLFASTDSRVSISAGSLRSMTRIDYRILRAGVGQFSVLVPNGVQVLGVNGADLREWKIEAAGNQQRVIATANAEVREKYSLEITTESALNKLPANTPLPVLSVENVERQNGSIAVSAETGLTAAVSDLQGLTQQNAANSNQEGFVGSYRYLRMPFAANIAISEATPVITVESQTVVTVETETRRFQSAFKYNVRKAGIFETTIQLPAGFTEAEATGDVVESSSVANNVLTVRLKSRKIGDFSFTVSGDANRKTPDEPLTIPIFTPQNVERHDARVALAVQTSLKATTQEMGDLRQDDVRNITAVAVKSPDSTPLTLGFRYRLGASTRTATIAFEQRKPRVSVEVLASSDLRESLVRDTWKLVYNIEYAGVAELSFAVPKEIADDLQIDGPTIQERQRSEEKDAAGKPTGAIVWTIRLQDKVLGQTELSLSLERPQTKLQQGAAATVALPEIRPLNVFRETGQVAIIKAGNIEITRTEPKNLELIDPRELDSRLQREGIFLAYKYATHPVALSLALGKNLYLDVPQALVTHAVLTSVIAENQAETTEVIYWLRNNSQQFISVQLPQGGRMLSDAFVNGDPQQPSQRPGKNEVLIRLPAGGSGNQAFPVRFIYEVPSKKPDSGLWPRGTIETQPPVLNGVEVVQTKWTLYLPGGFRYVKFGGPMREIAAPWGWDGFRRLSDLFVPQFGPQPRRIQSHATSEPPPLPPAKGGGFDFQIPKEGVAVTLRRMDAPATIATHYRSKTYANIIEAILFFVALYGGVRLLSRAKIEKFRYALVVGIGSLIIAGAVAPRAAGMWTAIYLGALAAAGVWFVVGFWRKIKSIAKRRPKAPDEPTVPPVLPTETEA